MADTFDGITALSTLLAPGTTTEEAFAYLSRLESAQQNTLIAESYRQGVAAFLYPILVKLSDVHKLEIPDREKLHQTHLSTAARNLISLHSTHLILTALREAGIQAMGLKGVYLLEHVYPEISTRSMSDIDILVKKQDLSKSLQVMRSLGYRTTSYFNLSDENFDTKHVPPMEKDGLHPVELHWTLLEEDEPFRIDADDLWRRAIPARIADVETAALCPEDLILHLSLHLTYQHYLTLGLRGLLDIALVIHTFHTQINWQKLVRVAQSWGSEKVTALTLQLVESQLGVPIPPEVIPMLVPEGIEPSLLENARIQLLNRPSTANLITADLYALTASRGLLSKLKIGLERVFIPRIALARIYNVPPNSPRVAWYYAVRFRYLLQNYGKTLIRLLRGEEGTKPALQNAEISKSLREWMTPGNTPEQRID